MNTAEVTREAVAAEVRAAMGRKRMTQAVLAKRLGVSRVWVSERLSAKRPFTTDHLVALCEVLELDLLSLFPSDSAEADSAA